MQLNLQYLFCIVYLFGYSASSNIDPDEVRAETIDVRPLGKRITEEKDLEGFTCSFTYQAEGGTDEQWLMKLSVDETKTQFACSVERESGMSYLYFENFVMTGKGGKTVEGTVLGSQGKPLEVGEYKVDIPGNTVSSVDGKFEHMLDKVEIVLKKQKEEL
ncbi:myeloid-derived growth factor-like [Mytilus galloprovincialis]|uniref:myeloid-derived growth factor-like n=1 Tax=Mytilus galloprovincialis TaxID=29158 RepID=UPI003F7B5AFC